MTCLLIKNNEALIYKLFAKELRKAGLELTPYRAGKDLSVVDVSGFF
jgi:hypothetical protein